MIETMKRLLLSIVLGLSVMAPLARAADEDGADAPDPRIENYATKVAMPGSTAPYWMLFLFLSVCCVAALMKNPKRSHLD